MLYIEAFTKWSLCAEQLLNTDAFTHGRFYAEKTLHWSSTEKLLHTEAATQSSLYTQTLLDTEAFTHRSLHTQKLLHGEAATQSSFYTQKLLLYTRKLSGTEASTRRSCCTKRSLQFTTCFHRACVQQRGLVRAAAAAADSHFTTRLPNARSPQTVALHKQISHFTGRFGGRPAAEFSQRFARHQPNSHFPTFYRTFGHPTRTISAEDTQEPVQFAFYHTFGFPTCTISGEGHVSMDVHGAAALGEI